MKLTRLASPTAHRIRIDEEELRIVKGYDWRTRSDINTTIWRAMGEDGRNGLEVVARQSEYQLAEWGIGCN